MIKCSVCNQEFTPPGNTTADYAIKSLTNLAVETYREMLVMTETFLKFENDYGKKAVTDTINDLSTLLSLIRDRIENLLGYLKVCKTCREKVSYDCSIKKSVHPLDILLLQSKAYENK